LWCACRMRALGPIDEADAAGALDAADATAPARSVRVLVVDDNVDSAEMVCAALEQLGHRVAMAHDGAAAVDQATAFAPEVVLLDLGLPEIDGFEVARRLRRSGSRAHLVALTGYGLERDRAATREAGFDAHLVKPVDLATLQDAIAAAAGSAISRGRATT